MTKSILTKHQTKKVNFLNRTFEGEKVDLIINIRYDDQCGNGHNSFSITGDLYKAGSRSERNLIMCGCIHNIIKVIAPEYNKYIKWHLMNSDMPMHYISNTLYHANTKDCWGLEKGEVRKYNEVIKFKGFNISFKKDKEFIKFLQDAKNKSFKIIEVSHKDTDGYKYSNKYTFKGYEQEWYKCPFDTIQEAEEWQKELFFNSFEIIKIPTSWGEGKESDLEGARISAIAPKATLEQLQNKEWLTARLPKLKNNFKKVVEELGFIY